MDKNQLREELKNGASMHKIATKYFSLINTILYSNNDNKEKLEEIKDTQLAMIKALREYNEIKTNELQEMEEILLKTPSKQK